MSSNMSENLARIGDQKPKDRPLKRLLSVKDGAEYLGVSVYTMRDRISRGQIPNIRDGARLLRLDIRDLDEWVEKHKERL